MYRKDPNWKTGKNIHLHSVPDTAGTLTDPSGAHMGPTVPCLVGRGDSSMWKWHCVAVGDSYRLRVHFDIIQTVNSGLNGRAMIDGLKREAHDDEQCLLVCRMPVLSPRLYIVCHKTPDPRGWHAAHSFSLIQLAGFTPAHMERLYTLFIPSSMEDLPFIAHLFVDVVIKFPC